MLIGGQATSLKRGRVVLATAASVAIGAAPTTLTYAGQVEEPKPAVRGGGRSNLGRRNLKSPYEVTQPEPVIGTLSGHVPLPTGRFVAVTQPIDIEALNRQLLTLLAA